MLEMTDINKIFCSLIVSEDVLLKCSPLVYSSHLCLHHVLQNHKHHHRIVNEFIHFFEAKPEEISVEMDDS